VKGAIDQYVAELKKAGKPTDNLRIAGGHFWLIPSADPEKNLERSGRPRDPSGQ